MEEVLSFTLPFDLICTGDEFNRIISVSGFEFQIVMNTNKRESHSLDKAKRSIMKVFSIIIAMHVCIYVCMYVGHRDGIIATFICILDAETVTF
jgi:hypothetical protein